MSDDEPTLQVEAEEPTVTKTIEHKPDFPTAMTPIASPVAPMSPKAPTKPQSPSVGSGTREDELTAPGTSLLSRDEKTKRMENAPFIHAVIANAKAEAEARAQNTKGPSQPPSPAAPVQARAVQSQTLAMSSRDHEVSAALAQQQALGNVVMQAKTEPSHPAMPAAFMRLDAEDDLPVEIPGIGESRRKLRAIVIAVVSAACVVAVAAGISHYAKGSASNASTMAPATAPPHSSTTLSAPVPPPPPPPPIKTETPPPAASSEPPAATSAPVAVATPPSLPSPPPPVVAPPPKPVVAAAPPPRAAQHHAPLPPPKPAAAAGAKPAAGGIVRDTPF